jgi:hypothetical protein
LGSPAEQALLSAIEKHWCHLDALMRLYSIEFLFVAWSVMYQGFVEPFASFDSGMIAYEMIFLFFQCLDESLEVLKSHGFLRF